MYDTRSAAHQSTRRQARNWHDEPEPEVPVRSFGSLVAFLAAGVALWPLWDGGTPRWWALAVSAAAAGVTLAAPAWWTMPTRAWLRLGGLLHAVVGPVVLAALYFVVFTPFAVLLRRVRRRDFVTFIADGGESAWTASRPPEADAMRRQF